MIGSRQLTLTVILALGLLGISAMPFPAAAEPNTELAAAQPWQQPPWPEKEFAPRGEKTCLRCHDEPPANLVLRTPHAQMADPRTPFAAEQCETCHGPSPEHLIKPKPGEKRASTTITFGRDAKTPVAQQNQVCLGCHESGLRMNWHGSQHQFADVPCVACHNVHSLKDKVLVKAMQPQVCFQCHVTQRAQAFMFSHHPIREGKVVCADCHNPHGSFGPKQLAKGTVNDTCFQCHTEKRGPFLWEHPPVRENCANCHTPHGSTQPRLLKVRTPWLCQQCHLADFHPSTAFDGTDLPTTRQLVAKGCTNCHSTIHGSNHPSGVRFLR